MLSYVYDVSFLVGCGKIRFSAHVHLAMVLGWTMDIGYMSDASAVRTTHRASCIAHPDSRIHAIIILVKPTPTNRH